MMTTDQHVERLWTEFQKQPDQQHFREVFYPMVFVLNQIAGGGMFSETACIVAARKVLGY